MLSVGPLFRWSSGWSRESAACWPELRTGESYWTLGSTLGWLQGEHTAGNTVQQTQHHVTNMCILCRMSHFYTWCHFCGGYTPADMWTGACPRIAQHRSMRSHWLSCDSHPSGCSTVYSREAPPTLSQPFCLVHLKNELLSRKVLCFLSFYSSIHTNGWLDLWKIHGNSIRTQSDVQDKNE